VCLVIGVPANINGAPEHEPGRHRAPTLAPQVAIGAEVSNSENRSKSPIFSSFKQAERLSPRWSTGLDTREPGAGGTKTYVVNHPGALLGVRGAIVMADSPASLGTTPAKVLKG
jgi:hypothetical protein